MKWSVHVTIHYPGIDAKILSSGFPTKLGCNQLAYLQIHARISTNCVNNWEA